MQASVAVVMSDFRQNEEEFRRISRIDRIGGIWEVAILWGLGSHFDRFPPVLVADVPHYGFVQTAV